MAALRLISCWTMTKSWGLLAGVAGLAVLAASPPASERPPCVTTLTSTKAATIGALIDSADSVVTYRVDPEGDVPDHRPDTTKAIWTYPVTSVGRTASVEDRDAIRSVLLEPDAHHVHPSKCGFSPGVGIEFVEPDTSAYLLICFSCSQWVLGRSPGKLMSGDFQLARKEFVELVKQLLPDDPELARLVPTDQAWPGH